MYVVFSSVEVASDLAFFARGALAEDADLEHILNLKTLEFKSQFKNLGMSRATSRNRNRDRDRDLDRDLRDRDLYTARHVRTRDFDDDVEEVALDSRHDRGRRDRTDDRERSRGGRERSRDRARSSDNRDRDGDRDQDRDRVRSSRDRDGDRDGDRDARRSRTSRRTRNSDSDEEVRGGDRGGRSRRSRDGESRSRTSKPRRQRSPSPSPEEDDEDDADDPSSDQSLSEDDERDRRRRKKKKKKKSSTARAKDAEKRRKKKKPSTRLMPVRDLRKCLISQQAYAPEEASGKVKAKKSKTEKKDGADATAADGSESESDSDSDDEDDERVLGRLSLGCTVLVQLDDSRKWSVSTVMGWKESGRVVSVQARNKDTAKNVPSTRVKHVAHELAVGAAVSVFMKSKGSDGDGGEKKKKKKKFSASAEEEVDATITALHSDGTVSLDLGDGAAEPTRLGVCKLSPASIRGATLAVGCIVEFYASATSEWHLGRVTATTPPKKVKKKKKSKKVKKSKKDESDLYAPRYSLIRLDGEELQRRDRTDVPASAIRVVTGDVRNFHAALEECRDGGGTLTEGRFTDALKCIFGGGSLSGLNGDAIGEVATRYELSLAALFRDIESDAEEHKTAIMYCADVAEAELEDEAEEDEDRSDDDGEEGDEAKVGDEDGDRRDEGSRSEDDDEMGDSDDDDDDGRGTATGRRSAIEESIDAAVRRKFKDQFLALVGEVYDRLDGGDNLIDANKLPQMLALLLVALSDDEISEILRGHSDVAEEGAMTRSQFKALATEAYSAAQQKPKAPITASALRALFESLDVDHDGSVTFLEWRTAMETEWGMTGMQRELEAMVGLMDTDGDGAVSFAEFSAAISEIIPMIAGRHSKKNRRGKKKKGKKKKKSKKMKISSAEWVGEVPRLSQSDRAQQWLRDNPDAVFGLKRFMMGKIRPVSRAVEIFKFMPYSMTEATLGKLETRVENSWDCALRLPAKSGFSPPETRPVNVEILIKAASNVYYPDGDAKKQSDAIVAGADGEEVVNVARDVVARVLRVTLIDDPDDVCGAAQRAAMKEAPGAGGDDDGGAAASKSVDEADGETSSAAKKKRGRSGQAANKQVPRFVSNQACVVATFKGGAKSDTWKFDTAEHKMNELLIRCDGVASAASMQCKRVYVCFELCMVVHCRKGLGSAKPSSLKRDDPVMEVSCGWGVVPLFEQDPPDGIEADDFGKSLEGCKDGKKLDIPLIAGSPLAPIRIKPTAAMQGKKSVFRRAVGRGSKAVLSVVVNKLGAKKPYTAHAPELPHTLVAPIHALSHITRVRGMAKGIRSSAHIDALPYADPAALIFPSILADPFVFATFLTCWGDWVAKSLKRQKSRLKQGATSVEKRELEEHKRLMKGRYQTFPEDGLMPKEQLEGFRECSLRMWPASCFENVTSKTWGANKASLSTRDAMARYVVFVLLVLICVHAHSPHPLLYASLFLRDCRGGGALEERQKILDTFMHLEIGDFFGKDKDAGPVAPFHIDELT